MDQLVNLTTRALVFVYFIVSASIRQQKEVVPIQAFTVDTFSCPPTTSVSCPAEEPMLFADLKAFLAAGGKVHANCGIDSASFQIVNKVIVNQFCNKTTSTIYQVSDSCGGSNTCMHVIQVRDQTTPSIVCPGLTLACDAPEPTPKTTYSQWRNSLILDGGSVSDNCGLDTSSWAFLGVTRIMVGKCLAAIVHKYTISDSCTNQAICNQRFSIVDNQLPLFIPARDTILYVDTLCFADTSVANLGGIKSAVDNCGIDSILHRDVKIPGCSAGTGMILRIWRVVDNCNNATVDTQFISILDTIKPKISGPAGTTLLCSADVPAPDTNLIIVSDNCSQVKKAFFKDSISDSTCLNNKRIFRFYIASDQCNNTVFFTQVIRIMDTIPPLMKCPDSLSVSCIALVPVKNPGLAIVTDQCDKVLNVNVRDSVINMGCTNHQTVYRIYSTHDTCGNASRCTQIIKVNDLIPPTINCPANATVECMDAIPTVNTASVTASDNCSGTVQILFQKDSTINVTCNNKKTINRFYTATDSCNNISRCLQVITVDDKTAPAVLTFPHDTTLDCASKIPAINTAFITATDNCGGLVTVTHLKDSISDQICTNNKKINRIYAVGDECGNTLRLIQLISILDTVAPTISGPSNTQILTCNDPFQLMIPVAMDNCQGIFGIITRTDTLRGNCPGNYDIVYTFTATDSCNNIATRVDTVTYQDITPPSITCPPDALADCIIPPITSLDSFLLQGGSFFDPCGLDSNSFSLVKEIFMMGTGQIITTRTYAIKDQCGNADSCTQQITSPVCFVDLALKKTVNSPKNPFIVKPGGVVPFCITVYNQGLVATDSIKLIEYFPIGGTKIISPGWINNTNGTACKYLSRANGLLSRGGLLPGTNVQICFEVQLSDTIKGGEEINIAEINEVRDTSGNILPDIDSHADNDPANDSGGVPNSLDDDNIDGNANIGQDEDDADPALFFVAPALTCINNVNSSVSVDITCSHCFKASELLKGTLLPDSLYKVTLFDTYGNQLPTNCVGPEYLGYTITFSVSIPNFDNNSCWGLVKIEDKAPPQLDCKNDTLECIAYSRGIALPVVQDNCSGIAEVKLVKESWTDLGCTDTIFAGVLTRTLFARDKWNNSQTCDKKYYIRRINIDSVLCPSDIAFECPDTLNINNPLITGAPTYKNEKLWPLNATCNLFMNYSDQRVKVCGAGFKIFRTWIIGDVCSGKELKCVQLIKVEDHTPPRITSLTRTYNIPSDPHECFGLLDLLPATVTDCSNTLQAYVFTYLDPEIPHKSKTLTGPIPSKIRLPKGVNKLYIDIHDECNNYTRDSITVTVTDETPPTPICHSETQLTLDPNECSAWVAARDLDNGSHDNCCAELHYAVAYMTDIEAARTGFIKKLTADCGVKEYWDNKSWYDQYIEDWINAYVFKDTLIGTSCGTYQVVLRVYEACDLPVYDPHVFPCSPHAWYLYNTSWRYRVLFNQEFKKDGSKSCAATGPWDCKTNLVTKFNSLNSYNLGFYQSIPLYKNCDRLFGADLTPIACAKNLYNDCMINLLLDDKQLPHIDELATISLYCDGVNVPEGGVACTTSDAYGNIPGAWPGQIQVKGSNAVYGYYAGSFYPSHDQHQTVSDVCTNQKDVWSPVYCRKWLELDTFDRETKVNPYDLFYKPVVVDRKHASRSLNPNEFIASDNCQVDTVYYKDEKNINSCNEGWIQRTWTVVDHCGNTQTSTQKILIRHRSDFEVLFPEDKIVNCESKALADTGIAKAGIPFITDVDCEQIGVRYSDEIFYTEPDACYKIVRTWSIIDWCIFDANQHTRFPDIIVNDSFRANTADRLCTYRNIKDNNDGFMTYVQIIKIVDTKAPTLTCKDTSFCATVGCDLNINLPLTGKDNCSDTLFFRVDITNPDGSHDRRTNIQSIKGLFAVGSYKIFVIGEDGCKNADTCNFTLTIKDCKQPSPYCINGIATVVMPISGSIQVWAKDLNLNSSDNCTPADKLKFSFSKDIDDQSHTFTCKDIKNGIEQAIPVQIWVTDQAGLQDYCSTYLLLQDKSGNVCPDQASSAASLKGSLKTEQTEPVEFAQLSIKGQGVEGLPAFKTSADGAYYFGSLPMNSSYKISALRDDNPLNGVSTLDLVLIQKHILGAEILNSPYKMIAADVDGNNAVTAIDLLELRKLILGIYDKLPNSASWKFVPKSHTFTDPSDPWGYPVEENIQDLQGDMVKDFVGIKMGDVNNTTIPHSLLGTEVRSNANNLIFEVDDQKVTAGQTVIVSFKSPNFRGISGWQGTLSLGTLKFMPPRSGSIHGELNLSTGNIGTRWMDQGKLTFSWNETQTNVPVTKDIPAEKTLFELEFIATQSGYLSDMLRIGSQHTPAESYQGRGDQGTISLQFKDQVSKGVITKNFMDQNYPNPFNHKTMIGITLVQKAQGTLTIFDAAGRIIHKVEKEWNKGYNEIAVDSHVLGSHGMFYYKFQSGTFNDTKKMLLIE
jgi:hypothetical protein